MVNVSELLINTVNRKEPKLLSGFDQKGAWLDTSFTSGGTLTHSHRWIGRT